MPDPVRQNMAFTFVERMDEVLHLALLAPVAPGLADTVQPEPSPGLAGSTTPADRTQDPIGV